MPPRDAPRTAFLEWARLASCSRRHVIESANHDMFGRGVEARGIIGQVLTYECQTMKVVTVAPSRIEGSDKLVAFVRNAREEADGVEGCKELDLTDAFRRRERAYKRVPVNGEHVTLDDVGADDMMMADERYDAVQAAKAFFAYYPGRPRGTWLCNWRDRRDIWKLRT